jgi:hypothetical protein
MPFLRALFVCLGIGLFTWLGFNYFPGHTYLQSDTQIYLPMIERLDSPGFLARDIVATRPHISFTIYDEATLAIHRVLKFDFEKALVVQQLLYRAAAMLGVYLIAIAAGALPVYAFLISAFVNLGASLLGPAVLLIEYEPVPRGFAFGLVLLALGLLAHNQVLLAGLAGGLALLYQPPTALPFWGIAFLAFICDPKARKQWKPLLLTFLIACLLLANLAQLQPEVVESQNFLGRLTQRMVELQHFRTRYSWVSLWAPRDIWSYLGICICAFWATSRFWSSLKREMRWFFIGLPLGGVLSVPLSYLLLEHWRLAIIPQYQPARALLFTVAIGSIACGIASVKAAVTKRVVEAAGWFLVVIAIPLNVRVFDLFALKDRLAFQVFGIWFGLAVLTALLTTFLNRNWMRWTALAAPALAVFALPGLAHVETFPKLDKKPVTELAVWAKENTWGSSMFLFPDAGHEPFPGIFRALSERALWVDWKSGGQVNYFQSFAEEWFPRFEQTMDGKFTAERLEGMLSLPIDYYVLDRKHSLAGVKPVFENRDYVVYDAQALRNSSTSLRLGTDD